MSWLARLLIRFYPRKWRQRYEGEFAALLEDMEPLGRHLPDLLKGAFQMQMKEWGYLRFALAFAVVGLLAAAGIQFATPDRFFSQGIAHFNNKSDFAIRQQEVLSRASLSAIIREKDLYRSERYREPLEDVIEHMRNKDIRVHALSADNFLFEFIYPDRVAAQQTTQELMTRFTSGMAAEIVRGASLPSEPVERNRSLILLTGTGGGILLGLLTAGMLGLRPRTRILLAICGAGGSALFFAGSFAFDRTYVSTAVVRGPVKSALNTWVLHDEDVARFINEKQLYGGDHGGRIPTQALIRRFRKDLHIDYITHSNGVETARISFSYSNSTMAQLVVQRIVTQVNSYAVDKTPMEVLDNASLPQSEASPNRGLLAAIGLAVGLFAGALLARFTHPAPVPPDANLSPIRS
jgi:hypothetical protein